ncbi:MAG TPA: adenylate/guanylate cyclase domain-containing protein [Solirubrobacteraceae bacterium]|jgi:class 3 adenylate cyclase
MGLAEALPRRMYERTGARYLEWSAAWRALGAVSTSIVGVAATALYVDGSFGEYAVLAAASVAWYVADTVLYTAAVFRYARPVRDWLRGARGPEAAVAAWRAATRLPLRMTRRWPPYALGAVAAVSWNALAVAVLDLDAADVLATLPASYGLFLYFSIMSTLTLELAMRPVLEDVTPHLPADADPRAPRIPLRWRVLGTLPAISWGTAVVVGGVVSRMDGGPDALAVANGVALATFVASLYASLLLSDTVVGPVARLDAAMRDVAGGDLDVRAPVVSTDETGDLTRSFNTMVRGLRERERLREAFGAFVDPTLTERVLEEGVDLRGEEVAVSVLFMDVRGFTTISERSSPQEVVARLNELFDEVVPVILRHGGHANKFIADGLLAVFGAPRRLDDHADRAVAAALDVAACVRRRFGGELRVGVGVNSGPVLAGTIGGGGRLDFTVIGDAVNTAARVQAATRDTGDDVLVTEATVALLRADHGGFEERPSVPLKGKAEDVRLLAPKRLGGPAPDPRPDRGATGRRAGGTPPRPPDRTASPPG